MVSRNHNYDSAESVRHSVGATVIMKTKMVKLVQRRLVIEEIGYWWEQRSQKKVGGKGRPVPQ